ncbi:hypothetical protein EJB05_42899 [Eragrostis curvula]|uniref:Uncharacterized protein n=1 Tax=Eragrostis curvula TaxID=38414 RepID=A0A5J9TDY9_9POAL|nr:hypothetical protein EJB05_42899 [Eragrostis curvula]
MICRDLGEGSVLVQIANVALGAVGAKQWNAGLHQMVTVLVVSWVLLYVQERDSKFRKKFD